ANRPFALSIAESDQPPVKYSLPIAEDADSERHDGVAYRPAAERRRRPTLQAVDGGPQRPPRANAGADQAAGPGGQRTATGWSCWPETLSSPTMANGLRSWFVCWTPTTIGRGRLAVSECGPLHRPLLQLTATDADEDKRIRYRIAGTASPEVAGSFYISVDQLMQNRSLDYETVRQRPLYLPLFAEDSGGLKTEAEIEIRVTDCNDHYPNISVQLIDGRPAAVRENDVAEVLLARVIVRDEDEGENGSVSCAISEAQRHQFELQQLLADGSHVSYKLRKVPGVTFDREAATPKERRSEVQVEILDENDNSPVPDRLLYQFRTAENQAAGALVGRIGATDRDAGENARLSYRFADSIGEQFFELRPSRGSDSSVDLLTLVSLDREIRDRFNFGIVVSDNGKPVQQSATISVEVVVEDEDDSPPVFVNKEYSFSLTEDYGRNTSERFIGEVQATDADAGSNARIRYEVIGGGGGTRASFFFRDNRLYARGNLDRERQELLSLQLRAVGILDTSRTGSAHATVTLLDVNDNPPEFTGLATWSNLSAASPAGTQVTQLRAVDPDAGANGSVTFGLVGSDHGHFSIDPMHGIVTLVKALPRGAEKDDVDSSAVFRLVVRVSDGGQPPLSSRAESLYIRVVDITAGAAGGGSGRAPDGGTLQGAGRRSPQGKGGGGGRGMDAEQHVLILLCLA
uniref:PCD16 protein n=1 Tax=Macrostomum lignano TaxID=282301 RepID=A0A1I8GZ04_9PLAT